MATHRLPKFTNPDFLKTIAPERLISVFRPYQAYLSKRQFALPDDHTGEIDYETLSAIIIHPHEDVPRQMVEALYYIHEMSGIEQMDDLLAAAKARQSIHRCRSGCLSGGRRRAGVAGLSGPASGAARRGVCGEAKELHLLRRAIRRASDVPLPHQRNIASA